MKFRNNYGPWAVIAGASEGIGRAFSLSLARRGFHLVLIARKKEALQELSLELEKDHHINTVPLPLDLADPKAADQIEEKTTSLDVGLLVYNAALADTGPFLTRKQESLRRIVATNCLGPLLVSRCFGEKMAGRGSGGIILLSSMSGFQGTPYVAAYGASKAFNMNLAEGLWYELKLSGVDVLAVCPGPTGTPGFNDSLQGKRPPAFPPVLSPEKVAEESLKNLGKRSVLVPGSPNRVASFLIQKLLPRQVGVRIMGKSTGRMYGISD